MAIPEQIIDEVQSRTDIVEIISGYIPLKKLGKSHKALCPFHHEKTPSFVVSSEKQIYHCFGCGAGGNVFSFVMKHENIGFPEAVEMLAEKAGISIPKSSWRRDESSALANELYGANEAAREFFRQSLLTARQAMDYLESRGISAAAAEKFGIGYAPDSWEGLIGFAKRKGITEDTLEKAGLAIANDRGGHYDRFRNRIIFPISDLKGHILGFGGRVLDSSLPKYINSPETPIYSKGRNLYGLNISREEIKKEGHVLVVEGYLDFLIPYQAGIRNLIATLGTALTVDQIKLLKRFANTAIMVYDPDAAGETASIRNLDLFISEDVNVYVAELPPGNDPDGYIRKFGADDFRKIIKSSKNLFDYKIDKLSSRIGMGSMYGKTRIAAEMLSTIAKIGNEVLKSGLVKRLAERLGVDEESIKAELKKVKTGYARQPAYPPAPDAGRPGMSAEKMILALLLDGYDMIDRVREKISEEEFRDTTARDVAGAIFALRDKLEMVSPARLISHLGGESEAAFLVSEAVNISDILVDKDKALDDCVARIKKDNLKDRLDRIQQEIREAHRQKEDERVKILVSEYDSLLRAAKA